MRDSSISVEQLIYFIRGHQVMLDQDLARLYGVETKSLKRAVRRNMARFPADFMFELNSDELQNWRYQFGTSNSENMGLRYHPFAFTALGVAMLSSVLHSEEAITVNIMIMRVFAKARKRDDFVTQEEFATVTSQTSEAFGLVFERLDSVERKLPTAPPNRKKISLT